MKQILVILILAVCAGIANAQQVPFVPVCTGNATTDTTRIESLKTAIGSTTATITPPYKANPSQACTWNNVTIPFNITLDFTNGTAVKYAGNVHILGAIVNPTGKTIFISAGGSLSFLGNSFIGLSGQPKLTNGQGVENYGNPAPGGTAGGELAGTYPNPTVVTGTTANKIVRLDGSAKLPALDASQLINLPAGSGTVTHTAGPLSINAVMIGNGGADSKTQVGVETGVGTLQLFQPVITQNLPQLTITTTVNNGSENFTGIVGDWTNTASNSLTLMKLSVGGVDQFKIDKVGAVQLNSLNFGGNTNSFPALKRDAAATSFVAARLGDDSGATGMTASVFRTANGSQLTTFRGFDIASTHGIYFKTSTNPTLSDWDTELYRESAGVLAVVDGSGTPTNYRDLKVRNLYLSSPTGNIITLKAPSSGTPIYTWPSGFVAGQYMKVDALGNLSFGTPAGAGDVVGPGSATASALACFDGTSGKLIKDCGLTLSGTNTGDQNLFGSIVVSGQTTITPNSTNTALTVVAGSNITLTTDNTAKSITIAASAGGGGGLPDCGGNGYAVRSALNTSVCRTLQGTANQIAITNPTGVAGDSVFSIPTAAQLNIAKITNLTSNGFVKTGSGDGTLSVDTTAYLTANQNITLSGDVSGGPAPASITTTIGANKVLDAMLRQSPARSVIGRAGSTTGNVTDITATNASDFVLRESGGSIGFGTITTAAYANSSITFAKIQNVNASKLLGRNDSGAGPPVEITLGGGLVMSGATLSASGSVPAQTGLLGVVKLSAAPTDAANPVAVVTEDQRLSAATGARHVFAEQFAGDPSARASAADAALGSDCGTIELLGGGTYPSQVTFSTCRHIIYGPGTYTLNTSGGVAGGGPVTGAFLLKDNSYVELMPGAVIVENSTPACVGATCRYVVFETWATTQSPGNQLQSNNVWISGGQIQGVLSNPHDGGVQATIQFGNCWNCGVHHVWFNNTSGYAAQFGANPNSQKWAQNNWFTDNLTTGLQSQNVSVITGENIHIERNTFKDPGRVPFVISGATNASPIQITTSVANNVTTGVAITIAGVRGNTAANGFFTATRTGANTFTIPTAGNGAYTGGGVIAVQSAAIAVVDVEPNGDIREKLRNINISHNNFDLRYPVTTTYTGISYNPTAAGLPNEGGMIVGNIMLGRRASAPLNTITGATNASPIVIATSGGHEHPTGEFVTIASVGGNTAANGVWSVTYVDGTHFSLDGSTGNGVYTSGGTEVRWTPDAGFTSNGIFVSQYANGVTVAHNKLFRFSQNGILAQGTKLDVNNNTIEDSGNGGATAIETNSLTRSNVHDNFYSVRPGCPSCFDAVIHEGSLSSNNTYSNNVGFTYTNIQASSKVFSSMGVDSGGAPTALQFPNGFGINTVSPGAKLDINGAFTALNSNTDMLMGATNRNSFAQIGQDATHNLFVGWSYNATASSAYGDIHTYSGSNPLVLQVAGGNVGIGLTSPQSKLHTNGSITIDPQGVYNVFNFGATHAGLNFVGNLNCNSSGIQNGLYLSNRLNSTTENPCGDSPATSILLYGSMDTGNGRSASGFMSPVNFVVQEFPTIANGASNWTITSATNSNPVEFTMTSPPSGGDGFVSGDTFTIQGGTLGWTAVNGSFPITVTASNKFTIPVNSTSLGALSGTVKICYVCSAATAQIQGVEWEMYSQNPNIDDPLGAYDATKSRMSMFHLISQGGAADNTTDTRPVSFMTLWTNNTHSSTWPKDGIYMSEVYNRGLWFFKRSSDLDDPFKIAMIDVDAPGANIIKGESGRTVTNGIHLSDLTITGNAYDSSSFSVTGAGNLLAKSVRGTAVTFASLPTAVEGMIVAITDSTTAVWGATITGGGSNHVLGYYNGTNWTVAAK